MISGLPPPYVAERTSGTFAFVNGHASSPEAAWVQRQLPFYEDQYTAIRRFSLTCTTFNVGTKPPPPVSVLRELVPLRVVARNSASSRDDSGGTVQMIDVASDMIVVGLQEVDMSAAALWREETETAVPWIQGLQAAVGADASASNISPENEYFLLPPRQLVGMLVLLFVRKPLGGLVKDYHTATLATGAMGTLGNKGCVALRFQIHMSTYCFINAHLAAGQEHFLKRNEDAHNILTQLDFNAGRLSGEGYRYRPLLPQDHDVVVLLGDLNYRVDLPYAEAVARASKGDYEPLWKRDQLLRELRNPHTPLRGFIDHTPTNFPPTYRYDIGTSQYDTSEKRRIPAYTDRVLHWAKNARHRDLKLVCMDVKQQVVSSDHKPLTCSFSVPFRELVTDMRETVQKGLWEKVASAGLDRVSAAKVRLKEKTLDFGTHTHYSERTQHTITFVNEGECVAVVSTSRMLDPADESQAKWLRCRPMSFEVLPGEEQTVNVECVLDRHSLAWMSQWEPFRAQGQRSFKSMLVFVVENGPLSAVECSVNVLPSIFCNSLDNVLRLGDAPCREAYNRRAAPPPVNLYESRGGAAMRAGLEAALPKVPKEIWYLCDSLVRRASSEKELFTTDAEWKDVRAIMEFLDTSAAPIPPELELPHALAQCLMDLLKNFTEPIVPFAQFRAALASTKAGAKGPLYFVYDQIPAAHCNLFVYMVGFLRRFLQPQFSKSNELSASTLAQIFSRILLVRPVSTVQQGGPQIPPQELRALLHQELVDAAKFLDYFLSASQK